MKIIQAERNFRRTSISVEMIVTDSGVQVCLFGGDRSHIGAVGILDPAREITITQFENHKESVLCQQWCEALANSGYAPAVVSAGIHYDNATKEEIMQVITICDLLLEETMKKLCDCDVQTRKDRKKERTEI